MKRSAIRGEPPKVFGSYACVVPGLRCAPSGLRSRRHMAAVDGAVAPTSGSPAEDPTCLVVNLSRSRIAGNAGRCGCLQDRDVVVIVAADQFDVVQGLGE